MEACWSSADRERVLAETVDGLWRLLARHAAAEAPPAAIAADLTGTSQQALASLRHLHLILSPQVLYAVDEALPALLQRLRPVAPTRPLTSRVAVRGAVAWPATVATRATGGGDRALFVAAAACPHYGTAEARLALRTLQALHASCVALQHTVGAAGGAADGWTHTLDRVGAAVAAALQHPVLQTLDAAPVATDVTACRRSPRATTRALAAAYERWLALVSRPTPAALVEAIQQRVLVPLDDDALYEVWALVGAARLFDAHGWVLDGASLVGFDAVPLTYRLPGRSLVARLRFGHTSDHWRRSSRYRALFDRYGLPGATRRPDLIVELQCGDRRRHVLVEVKRTRDGGYIADSIYKVLGYLADFEAAFGDQAGTRALLLLWEGLTAPRDASAGDTLLLADHHSYSAVLQDAVRLCIEQLGAP